MRINEATMALIKEFEGLYLRAYQDSVGVWTIGWGITNSDYSITGTKIRRGLTITRGTAEEWLRRSLTEKYLPKVMKYDDKYGWNENEAGALVSFAFNIGSIDQLTANGTRSRATIRKKILEYNKAGGRVLRGLTRRRKAELALFNTPVKKSGPAGYSGALPALPPRGYYKEGDGIKTLVNYPTQLRRVQEALNWAVDAALWVDGKYGPKTTAAVKKLQKAAGIEENGCFGKNCLAAIKAMKK